MAETSEERPHSDLELDDRLREEIDHGEAVTTPAAERLYEIAQELGISTSCRQCEKLEQDITTLVFCRECMNTFHSSCWAKSKDHIASSFKRNPCKNSTKLGLHIWVAHLHDSGLSRPQILKQIVDDRSHRWVGIPESRADDLKNPELLLYSALTDQFNNSSVSRELPRKQFPRLVSFFGDTGTGKSTIIKNLIRLLTASESLDVPVTGTVSETQNSTSGGVHVYNDPQTMTSDLPIIYADCEGLRGSEPLAYQAPAGGWNRIDDIDPQSYNSRSAKHRALSKLRIKSSSGPSSLNDKDAGLLPIFSLPVRIDETKDKGAWQDVVVQRIYPRFLYIFSDAVCYTSKNSRTAEQDMANLVNWARNAHDLTTNQGVKPGLLYIINQDNHSDFTKWANVEWATQTIMEKLRTSKRFSQEKKEWEDRGAIVNTAEQLLRCYYSSVRVIFIPEFIPTSPRCEADALKTQYEALYAEICHLSRQSADQRKRVRVLFDLESLVRYSAQVLELLAKDYNRSVDLHGLADTFQIYPNNFKAHVLNFLSRYQESQPEDNKTGHTVIGNEISVIKKTLRYIAVCIAGEVVRNPLERGTKHEQLSSYCQKWKEVLEEFWKTRCRCEEMLHGNRCMNYHNTHTKGHQFLIRNAENVKLGDFKSGFADTMEDRNKEFHDCLQTFLGDRNTIPGRNKWSVNMSTESKKCGIEQIVSNRTCLTCLFRTPIHLLPCNHSLCDECAVDLNRSYLQDDHVLELSSCPLGCQWSARLNKFTITRKPTQAGVRILSLDGGGVRGIIELAILQSIIDKVGRNIPIQELFDLAVGTSTGGIIVLGIFKEGWTVEEATDIFESLTRKAFAERSLLRPIWRVPGARFGAHLICTYLYKSEGIGQALQEAFGDQRKLFGDIDRNEAELSKVAVVATGQEEQRPYLLSNYNREWKINEDNHNIMRREERPEHELTIWEAARCTSAAPTYFQPYAHPITKSTYIDGGMERNNPVGIADSERQFIWRNEKENSRDLIVSIGTGYSTNFAGEVVKKSLLSKAMKPFKSIGVIDKIATLRLVLENTTDCQKMWSDFRRRLGPDTHLAEKCHRVNVPYGESQKLCSLDAVSKMKSMKSEARAFLEGKSKSVDALIQRQSAEKIEKIARQLVASLFYFQVLSVEVFNEKEYTCSGLIRCRLSSACAEQAESLIQAQPAFRIYEESKFEPNYSKDISSLTWDKKSFAAPIEFRTWKQSSGVRIVISFDGRKNWENLSGFPRVFGDCVGDEGFDGLGSPLELEGSLLSLT